MVLKGVVRYNDARHFIRYSSSLGQVSDVVRVKVRVKFRVRVCIKDDRLRSRVSFGLWSEGLGLKRCRLGNGFGSSQLRATS